MKIEKCIVCSYPPPPKGSTNISLPNIPPPPPNALPNVGKPGNEFRNMWSSYGLGPPPGSTEQKHTLSLPFVVCFVVCVATTRGATDLGRQDWDNVTSCLGVLRFLCVFYVTSAMQKMIGGWSRENIKIQRSLVGKWGINYSKKEVYFKRDSDVLIDF